MGSLHVERFVARPLTEPVLHEAFEVQDTRNANNSMMTCVARARRLVLDL